MNCDKSYNLAGAICVVGLAFACAFMVINGKDGSGFGVLSGMCCFFWSWKRSK